MVEQEEEADGESGGRQGSPKCPRLLLDMRQIWGKPQPYDKTDTHRRLRKLFEEDVAKFIAQMNKLEREWTEEKRKLRRERAVRKAPLSPDVVIGDDDGTVRVRSLLERALEEFHEGVG